VAGLSLFLALVLGLVVVLVRDTSYEAGPPPAPRPEAKPAGAASALLGLVDAVETGDEDDAAALAPDDDGTSADLLRSVVAHAEQVRIEDLSARYPDEVGAVAADGSWTAAGDMTWAFAGFDGEPARSEVLVTFRAEGDRVAVEGIGGGDRRTPLWLRDELTVVRTADSLVLAADPADARALSRRVARGIPVVRRVLPAWHPSVVVEVPDSAAELDETLDVEPGTYGGIAAVTTTVDGSSSPDAPVHVFVNPDVTRRLRADGAQVVMSHELVHLATGAATSSVDLWLLEGFADYVALRDVDLPLTTTAARAVEQVRRDGVPEGLPGPTDFDTRADGLEAAYELAWLACRVVADEAGEQALVRLYREASDGAPTAAALRDIGLSQPELVRAWQRWLQDLAA
jgi:hypothetical protein